MRVRVPLLLSGLSLLAASVHAAPPVTALGVGDAVMRFPEPSWHPGSLSYTVSDAPVVSQVGIFGASADWKQRLFDLRVSTPATEDSFTGRKATWRSEGAFGSVQQEALLGPGSLDLRWVLDLREFSGNAEINVYLPQATLGVSPYQVVFQDGSTQKDQLWVEQRAALVNLRSLIVTTSQRRIAVDAGDRGGWQFQDIRRNEQSRGMYRMVLPLYGIKAPYEADISLSITVDPPAPELSPVDISSAANMGLSDDIEGDGRGGWTDQGDNDLRSLPTGVQYLCGIPFNVLASPDRAAIMLRGTERSYFLDQATLPVGRKATDLLFLHGCAWGGSGKTAFTATVGYDDGSSAEIPVRIGEEALDWWGVRDVGPDSRVAWRGANARAPIGLMALRWPNPHPERTIREIALRAGDGPVAGIVAITASSGPVPLGGEQAGTAKLPPLRVAAAGQIGLDACFRGTKLEPDWKAADLTKTEDLSADLLMVTEDLSPEKAEAVKARVRDGGRLLVFGPPPAGLQDILPVTMADPPVLRVIAPYWRWAQGERTAFFLKPHVLTGPPTSGFDPRQLPPTGALYEAAARPGTQVEATWESAAGESFPAVASAPLGAGRVTYFNFPRLYPACGGTDYGRLFTSVNRYWDPFMLELAYYAAGRGDVCSDIGAVFAAKALRETLLDGWADLQVRLEHLRALCDYTGTAAAEERFAKAANLATEVDAAIDAGDRLIEGLQGEEAAASYGQAGVRLVAALRNARQAAAALHQELLTSGKATAHEPQPGPPLWVGTTHLNHGLVYPEGPSRKWLYDWALKGMRRELQWNVFDIVAGGYGASQLRPDGKALAPEALDDIVASAGESGIDMILCTVGGAFAPEGETTAYTAEDNAYRADVLTRLSQHLSPTPHLYAFEPNNEPGMGAKPDAAFGYNDTTIGDFRKWLLARHADIAGVNRALGTAFTSADDITPPKPEEMQTIDTGDPRRALWAEWIEFRCQLMETMHRSDYEALRAVSEKPVFDRTAGDGMNWCGVPGSGALMAARQDRRSLWHDALGSHVISPFLLDYQVAMSRGKRIVQSEYYWSTFGGPSDGLRYRFGGNFMHPYQDNDARNFAAVGRNFWKAISRGNDLFTLYFANPTNVYAQYDEGYWGAHAAYWGDQSFKAMTYAMKVYPREINALRGELLGAHHLPQVGILEPWASIVHTFGTPIGDDVRDVQYEAEAIHRSLLMAHTQVDVVGEWRLQDDARQAAPEGASGSAMAEGIPPVLVVPYGLFLSKATQGWLVNWVREGGVLLCTGPAGSDDELGKPSCELLQAAFDTLEISRGDGASCTVAGEHVRRRWAFSAMEPEMRYEDGEGAVISALLGAGEIIVTGFAYLDAPALVDRLLAEAVARVAPPLVTADNPRVQLYLCSRQEARLLYVINEDHRDTQPVRLSLANDATLTDLRCGVTLSARKGLALALRPGEGRVYRIEGL